MSEKVDLISMGQAETWLEAVHDSSHEVAKHMAVDEFMLLVKDPKGNSAAVISSEPDSCLYMISNAIEQIAGQCGIPPVELINLIRNQFVEESKADSAEFALMTKPRLI